MRETLIWWNLRHPNIVPLYGVTPIDSPLLDASLAVKWMRRGSSRRALWKAKEDGMPQEELIRMMFGWVSSLLCESLSLPTETLT